jgi:hypothetical protein
MDIKNRQHNIQKILLRGKYLNFKKKLINQAN